MALNDLVVLRWGSVLIRVGTRTPDVEYIELLHRTFDKMLKVHPSVGWLTWLPEDAGLPEEPTRLRSVTMLRALGTRLGGVVVVATGKGFHGSVTRSVITGMTLTAGSSFPLKITEQLREGCLWLGEQMVPEVDGEQLFTLATSLGNQVNVYDRGVG